MGRSTAANGVRSMRGKNSRPAAAVMRSASRFTSERFPALQRRLPFEEVKERDAAKDDGGTEQGTAQVALVAIDEQHCRGSDEERRQHRITPHAEGCGALRGRTATMHEDGAGRDHVEEPFSKDC